MSTFVLGAPDAVPLRRRIEYERELNAEQLAVVVDGDGPCLVLAGAGSGKTRTLTYRVARLLEQGVLPAELLLLTFTNKAAREMIARVSALVGPGAQGIWGGTFHSIASRFLRVFAERLGYASNFSILDAEDARDLVKVIMKDAGFASTEARAPSAAVVLDALSYARNTQTPIEDSVASKYPHFISYTEKICRVGRAYQERKKAANVMDFDDLLSLAVILLEDPEVGLQIAGRFRYILVDEYQDTNALQARMVKALAAVHGNVLVVGDDAQSIYAFRGANIEHILRFPREWPNAKRFALLTNYRSTPEILDVANESLSHNQHQFEKELVAVRPRSNDKPKLIACASASQEAQYIAEQILALHGQGIPLRQIAVLFRSSAHSQVLEFELMKRDVPYEYRGGQKFFERAHIKDVLAFLRLAHNPQDEVAWLRALGLQQGIGAVTATRLIREFAHASSLDDIMARQELLKLTPRAQEGWRGFVRMTEEMRGAAGHPAHMIRAVMASPYQEYLEREYPNWRERLEDVEQLALFAEVYQELTPFLHDISLFDEVLAANDERAAEESRDRLVLSTIHQAKGLEWEAVFIMHLADQAFPNRRALADVESLEEERRLFYVAVTRARRHLFLSYPLTMGYDALQFNRVSLFIDEVPARLFERVELREARSTSRFAASSTRFIPSSDEESSWEEPVIDRSEDGDAKPKTSFLRDIDQL